MTFIACYFQCFCGEPRSDKRIFVLDATPLTPLAATYSTLHIPFSASRVRAYERVCGEWGLFSAAPSGCVCQRWNSGMRSSNKRHRRERKRENGSSHVLGEAQDGPSAPKGFFFFPFLTPMTLTPSFVWSKLSVSAWAALSPLKPSLASD